MILFRTVPEIEEMGIRILLNECESISRGNEAIYLAGIDDAQGYVSGSTTSKRQQPKFQMARFLSACRIHLKFTARLHMPASICF